MNTHKKDLHLISGAVIAMASLVALLCVASKGLSDAKSINDNKYAAVAKATVSQHVAQDYADAGGGHDEYGAGKNLLKSDEYAALQNQLKLTSRENYERFHLVEFAINAGENPVQKDAFALFSELSDFAWASTLKLSLLAELKSAPAVALMNPLFSGSIIFIALGFYLIGYGVASRKTKTP